MASVQSESPQAVSVLDAGEVEGDGGYTATELIDGIPLDEVARRRAPIPAPEATRYAVELLDACHAVQRHEQGRADTVVASAQLNTAVADLQPTTDRLHALSMGMREIADHARPPV